MKLAFLHGPDFDEGCTMAADCRHSEMNSYYQ